MSEDTRENRRIKMLGGRVPAELHREFQAQIFRAQETHPDLTMQNALSTLVRLLRDENVWKKFLQELEK